MHAFMDGWMDVFLVDSNANFKWTNRNLGDSFIEKIVKIIKY
jgi:hypothetical protein